VQGTTKSLLLDDFALSEKPGTSENPTLINKKATPPLLRQRSFTSLFDIVLSILLEMDTIMHIQTIYSANIYGY